MSDLSELVRIEDPNFYIDDPYPTIARMQDEEPVFYYEPLDMWVLTKYEDVRQVGRDPLTFTTRHGFQLNDFRYGSSMERFFAPDVEHSMLIDPPRLEELRRILSPAFRPSALASMEATIRDIARGLIAGIEPGGVTNWTESVATPFPVTAIAVLLGMPTEDTGKMLNWAYEIMKMGRSLPDSELAEVAKNLEPMGLYLEQLTQRKRAEPGEDIVSSLVAAEDAGQINHNTTLGMIAELISAGSETARNVIAGGMAALAKNPEQYAKLVADPSLAKNATEELLRVVTPARGFGRTVTSDTEVRGQAIREGQHTFNFFMAANLDREVFPEPQKLDIERMFNKMQLAFGFGAHGCLGAALARMEIRIMLEEVSKRFHHVETVEEPEMDREVLFGNFWTKVALRFS
jgi:cytochrome P450